ncbi:ABC transporter permease [uncultured Parabacteroides sp.]|uniref:ABC transporter permease n=1 Tax=uncultured Parabacteroides sp. TaxID=512312 RepID=UPI0025E91608|nr:ABC transporter permease [uncultured Parabacteroides sp.]
MNNIVNIKSFLKFLSKNKAYTAIDVFGLSVSLMFVILIAVYVERELNIDKQQVNYDRIYAIGNENFLGTGVPVPYWLEERYPEIEQVCPVVTDQGKGMQVYYGEKKYKADVVYADSTFFSMFSFKVLDGNRAEVMKSAYDAVISESFANKAFPGENPVGKSIRISDSTSVTVTGVMEDINRSVIPYTDILLRLERLAEFNSGLTKTSANNAGSAVGFIQLKPGADLKEQTGDIIEFLKDRFWLYEKGFAKDLYIVSIPEIYFGKWKYSNMNSGDRSFSLVLMSVGILILIFAIINYINLTVAQASQRAREMATRRLLGSLRSDLFVRLMMEATLLTVVSFGIGLLLAIAALPFANDLLQVHLTLDVLWTPLWGGAIAAFILLTGFLSGLLPAVLISSAKPIDVVRGTFRRQTKMVFSKFFITFQNIITIVMIAASLTMYLQINHLIHAPLGYNTENIIQTNNVFHSRSEMEKAEDMLRQIPYVKAVGYTNGTPSSGTNNLSGDYEGKSLSFQQMQVDSAAFRIFGMEIKTDNHVANSDGGWFLNELAFKEMELPEDAATFKMYDRETPILGVIKDFHLWDISRENSPLMLRFNRHNSDWWPWSYVIEVQGDPMKAFAEVRKVFEEVSGVGFEGEFIDQDIQSHFESQIRLTKIVVIFACIAILISLLGLLAMSTYFIHQRAQEVAIRKVFGSDNRGILFRLVGTFLMYVGVAFVIATPIGWYFMDRWLADYSYRITLSPMIFITAGLFCLVISFFSVFFQSWRAANANPVESVKDS